MKILLIGGYGNFGKRLAANLLGHYDYEVIIAGRSASKASTMQQALAETTGGFVGAASIDVTEENLADAISLLAPDIVVNASGPFQLQRNSQRNYSVARVCLEVGSHYIDLADDRQFVTGIIELDALAKAKGRMIVSGASTVPGLSTAVIDAYAEEFASIEEIRYGITPGNKTERGAATIGSILSYTGKPFTTVIDNAQQQIYGWQNLNRYDFGKPLGKRWMSNCDIPDLDLLPRRYPSLRTVRFQAGLEVSVMHLGLWCLSGLVRIGLVSNLAKYTNHLRTMSNWFLSLGTGDGGMYVELHGKNHEGHSKKICWQLIAEHNVGPNVPVIAAELLINRIAAGAAVSGAMPCEGLFTLKQFFSIAARWNIYQRRV